MRFAVLTDLTAKIVSSEMLPSVIWKKSTDDSEDPVLSIIRVDDLIVERFTKAVSYLTLPGDVSSQFLIISK